MQQLQLFEKDSYEIQARVKRGIEAEQETKIKDTQLGSLKDKERDLQRQLDQKETECDLKKNEIERLNSRIETMQSYQATLE